MSNQQEHSQQPFSEAALSEATVIEESISANLLERTEVAGITINNPLTKACDTAFWIKKNNDGYTLFISIADIGSFITPQKTPILNEEAYIRAFAHHTEEGVFAPLLPDALAEGCLSLLEGRPCPTLTLSFPLDASFHISEPSFQHTFVHNRKQFTYEEADQTMADVQAEFSSVFQNAFYSALILWNQRILNDTNAYYDIETGWVTTEDGDRILLTEEKRYQAYIIVHEFRILANQYIASYLAARELPALYRNRPPTTTHPTKATYAPTREGHAGLQVPVYLHATLPLRNYADLVNQRILLADLRGKPSPYTVLELEAIAISLNTKEAIIKAAKNTYFRDERDQQLQKRLEEETLESLTQKEFHSVIRKAAEDQTLTPEITQEIYRRLEHILLEDNDLYTLVFRFQNCREEWKSIRRAVCHYLQKNPSSAAMIFNRGLQQGKWEVLEYNQSQSIPGYFQAKVSLQYEEQKYTSSFHTAYKKEQAKQLAIAEALASIAGIVLQPPEVEEAGSSTESQQKANAFMDFLKHNRH